MNRYELEYKQPYEYDGDSGSGIGDHSIGFRTCAVRFQARSDKEARQSVKEFVGKGSITFTHHIDGDGKTYNREFVRLVKELKYEWT